MRFAISGASGFIGRHLVSVLAERGHDVLTIGRNGEAGPSDRAVGEAVSSAGQNWPADIDVFVHLAALNPARGEASSSDEAALGKANVDLAVGFAARCAALGIRRFVFLSTANVHAGDGMNAISEDSRLDPSGAYARSKLEAERRLGEIAGRTGLELCVLRPVAVYGVGTRSGYAALLRLAATGLPLPLASVGNARSVLAVENCADAIVLAGEHPDAAGQTFLVADAAPVSTAQMIAFMRSGLGGAPRLFAVPSVALWLPFALLGRRNTYDRLFGSFVVDTARIKHLIGWRPRAETAAAMGDFSKQAWGRQGKAIVGR